MAVHSDSIANVRERPRGLLHCHSVGPHRVSAVLSPKVLGIAVARYDFCARDMRELSLLKGDVVKIYTKMSGNGWWRGEVNGKVSRPSRVLVAEGAGHWAAAGHTVVLGGCWGAGLTPRSSGVPAHRVPRGRRIE